jgi:ligand-binding SRPBCC domain-containing protein
MATFTRETVFEAPLEQVWDLHTTGNGLVRLTPSFVNLRIEAVRGGEVDEPLPEGAEIDVSTHVLELGPRDHWTSVVTDVQRSEDTALFRDEMRDGFFDHWVHTHRFERVFEGETLMRDHIEYELPMPAGLVSPLATVGLAPLFRYRHWAAWQILEP